MCNFMTTNIVIAGITSFFFGSCIGSFFKLVIDRYGTENSFVFKPSFCLNCKNKLNWWQNIPIISYLLLRGKCFFYKTSIDPTCFYWEMFIAMITLIIFISGTLTSDSLFKIFLLLFFFLVLILLSMFDLKHRIIPHFITYTAIIFIIASKHFLGESVQIVFANLGIAFIFMDLLYFFSMLVKRLQIEINLIAVPLLIWIIYFLFSQNIIFIFIPVFFFFVVVLFADHDRPARHAKCE